MQFNPLLHHDIGDGEIQDRDTTRGDTDTLSVTLSEETVSLVRGTTANPDRHLCIFGTSFIVLSFLMIALYSTGYLVPGTVILCCSIGLALGLVVKSLCGHMVWGRRRDLYSQL